MPGKPTKWISWTLAIALIVASAWGLRRWQLAIALRHLPEVDRTGLEPEMIGIIDEWRAAVIHAPFSSQAWGTYGTVLLAQEFVAEAIVCYARAERLDRSEARWPYMRGLCLERQDPLAAIDCFRRAALLRDELVLPKIQLAEMLLGRNEQKEAERHLRRAVALAPDDPRVLLALGRLAFMRDQLDEALDWTSRAAQLDPQRRRIQLLLCEIYQRRGDQAAVDKQLQLLETIPETGWENEWPDAILQEVAQYKRGSMWTLQMANEQIFAGQFDQAIELLQKAGGNSAADPRLIVLLGKAYLRADRTDEAAASLAEAVRRDPTSAPAHFELGNLALVNGNWNDAAEHYRECIRRQPDFVAAHYNLGLYHRERGEVDAAIAALTDACRYGPSNFPAHRELAEVLFDAGRAREAAEHLEIAARLSPNDPKLLRLMERELPTEPN